MHIAVGCGRGSMFEKRLAQRLYLKLRVVGGTALPILRSAPAAPTPDGGAIWREQFSFWPLDADLEGCVLRVEVNCPRSHVYSFLYVFIHFVPL